MHQPKDKATVQLFSNVSTGDMLVDPTSTHKSYPETLKEEKALSPP
jgi:hypothetical protein